MAQPASTLGFSNMKSFWLSLLKKNILNRQKSRLHPAYHTFPAHGLDRNRQFQAEHSLACAHNTHSKWPKIEKPISVCYALLSFSLYFSFHQFSEATANYCIKQSVLADNSAPRHKKHKNTEGTDAPAIFKQAKRQRNQGKQEIANAFYFKLFQETAKQAHARPSG